MRKTVKKIVKLIGKRGFTSGVKSSISQRLESDSLQITPQEVHLCNLKKKMVLTFDSSGNAIYDRYGWQPTVDLSLHLAVYKSRGDVDGIIHAHPPYLSALGLAADKLDLGRLPENLQVLGQNLEVESLQNEAGEASIALVNALMNGNVVLLPEDGVLVVGRTLEHAFDQLTQMEHDAQVFIIRQSVNLIS